MSGIAGIFYRNSMSVSQDKLERIGRVLADRGPHGISYYRHNSIGLVHCMLHDTPESLLEKLPYETDDKRLVITFHGRIDNRKELIKKVSLKRPVSETTDSNLVLSAYEKWGIDSAKYILGDFSFAIWDESGKKLYCARDRMGVNPFFYYFDDDCLIFASEIKGILCNQNVSKDINYERIADYITCGDTDKISTFYKKIFRLSPAHYLVVNHDTVLHRQYYEFLPNNNSNVYKNNEYYEAFREIFNEAVSCRLRSAYRVGAYLSGGLDSSSIACVAAKLLDNSHNNILYSFSGVFNTIVSCDERLYFQSILDQYKIYPQYLVADEIKIDKAYDEILQQNDEPFFVPHCFMMHHLLPMARNSGVRILLDGHDGDSAISYGLGLFPELLINGQLFRLVSEFQAIGNPTFLELIKRIVRTSRDILYANPMFPQFKRAEDNYIDERLIKLDPIFRKTTNVEERLRNHYRGKAKAGNIEKTQHLRKISMPQQLQVVEFIERQSAHQQIVPRFPFFDVRIIEFCLALPASEKFHSGYNRLIVRKGLSKLLPDVVRNRKTKTNFTPNLWNAISRVANEWHLFCIDNSQNSAYNFILDKVYVHNLRLENNTGTPLKKDLKKMFDLIKITILFKWLSHL